MIGRECWCFALHSPFLLLRKQPIDKERKLFVFIKIHIYIIYLFFAVFLPINFPTFHLSQLLIPGGWATSKVSCQYLRKQVAIFRTYRKTAAVTTDLCNLSPETPGSHHTNTPTHQQLGGVTVLSKEFSKLIKYRFCLLCCLGCEG